MLSFIDTAVIAYSRYQAPQQPACEQIMTWVAQGRLPAATSVLVLEETWHLEHRGRPPLPAGTAMRAAELFPLVIDLRRDHLRAAMAMEPSGLGPADRLHVAVATEVGCEAIITTDRAFDECDRLRRIDPLDEDLVRALLKH
ncbi:hypothetical protein GCM10023321_29190 [Pseudonocardia eucalypti]|uniref:Ribonuclease VapC n=1 Tax=Pseudonocardia eucalypti TaxID=648755 RepID=A0ABP9Q209_9PSEU|nr:putative nucleic acid-binding protein [Pseudonocardia eucalypti]